MSSISQREKLRAEHGVRPLSEKEEGTGLKHLPGGVFGFTYAPTSEAPLFAKHNPRSFEVHKMADGTARLLCFVEPQEKARVYENRGDVKLYPDEWGPSTELVVVRYDDVAHPENKLTRDAGNPIRTHLG